ncbi:hypothetical protein NMG60_11034044 [Bertholletia excelsa]
MVLHKRLDYGFIGYQVLPTPRATRSARKRGSFKKKVDDSRMCAFDLLATVAGKLLLEGETSPSSSTTLTGKEPCTVLNNSIKNKQQGEGNDSKPETCDQGSDNTSIVACQVVSQVPILHHSPKESSHAHNDDSSGFVSVITTSNCSQKLVSTEKLAHNKSEIQLGSSAIQLGVASSGCKESCDCTLENDSKQQIKMEPPNNGNASISSKTDSCCLGNLELRDSKPPTLVSVDNSVKLPFCSDNIPSGSFPVTRDDVKLVIRDDDENSSGCSQPSTSIKAFKAPPRIGDRRIRKLLASKYWKVTPKLTDEERSNADSEIKPVCHNRNNYYKRQRSQRDYPFKKRKLYDSSSVSNSDGGINGEGIAKYSGKRVSCNVSSSAAKLHGASGTPARVAGQRTSLQPRDSHVKLRIKSFKVPELFIELPESATVGSLKRTVLEAVTTILGGGLRVGVLLQGKKIRDDNKTLLQTGISHDNKLDALGFSLEPNPSQAPAHLCDDNSPLLLTYNTPPQPLKRYPHAPGGAHDAVQQRSADAMTDQPLMNLGNFVESDHDSAPSPPDVSVDNNQMSSRALIAVPEVNAEALSVVPLRKSKRPEAVQRRIRRPFSVSEVEALVQAVEKLGTGRWRDVKLCAFDNAKHRTYVDLKDKWKTLVHTARISPQQRRGEPVPQELLDRVLTAHAYWSQQQAKQQLKHQTGICLA